MNTVLGVILLIANGQIVGAKAVGAYPSSQACSEAVKGEIKTQLEKLGAPPAGVEIARMCVDLSDDLAGTPRVKT